MKLAEILSPITKNLETFNETTKQIGGIVKKLDVQDGNIPIPAIENLTGTQSLRDTLILMKKSKKFFKLEEKDNGYVFWNKICIKPTRDNRISINDDEFDTKSNFQAYFTNTKLTAKNMDDEVKITIFNILTKVGVYDIIPKKG